MQLSFSPFDAEVMCSQILVFLYLCDDCSELFQTVNYLILLEKVGKASPRASRLRAAMARGSRTFGVLPLPGCVSSDGGEVLTSQTAGSRNTFVQSMYVFIAF